MAEELQLYSSVTLAYDYAISKTALKKSGIWPDPVFDSKKSAEEYYSAIPNHTSLPTPK